MSGTLIKFKKSFVSNLSNLPNIAGVLGILGLGLLISSCSNNLKPASQSVNNLSYDSSANYQPVPNQTNQAANTQKQVITEIIPIPGQLMPLPSNSNNSNNSHINTVNLALPAAPAQTPAPAPAQTPQQLVSSMNQAATQTPAQGDFFNAMMTYEFMPGAVYTIYCAPLNLTDVALEPGEKIISIAAGDTLRWQVTQTYSGAVGNLSQHIILKPNSPNLSNSLLITTDHRVYHLILKSLSNNSYMVAVNWHYQSSPLTFVSDQAQGYTDPATGAAISPASTGSPFQLDLANLDFNYQFGTVKGDKPSWYPTRVFNDGRQTFIEFPTDFYNSDLPVLYLQTGTKSYGTMFNWRLKGRYMIIDAVVQNARLESGVVSKNDQVIVQISHS